MRVCLLNNFSNLTVDRDNHKGLEAMWLEKLMLQSGADEVDFVGIKGRNNAGLNNYLHYEGVKLDEYDRVFVQLSPPNFFGGKISPALEWLCRQMVEVTMSKITFLPTDPNIPPRNPASILWDRTKQEEWHELIGMWDSILDNAHYISPGPDIGKFIGWIPKNWNYVPWFYFVHANCLDYHEPQWYNDQDWGVCYWGAKRGGYREKKLRHFLSGLDESIDISLVAYTSEHLPNRALEYDRCPQNELWEIIGRSCASLIVGDSAHNDNVVTFRLWEAIAGGSVPIIDVEFDSKCKLERLLDCPLRYAEDCVELGQQVKAVTKGELKRVQEAAMDFLDRQAEGMELW